MNKLRSYIYGSFFQKTGFFVRGTGHYILEEKEAVKKASHAEIFWCIAGSAVICFQGKEYLLEEENLFYFPPDTIHDVTPLKTDFEYRWLSIDGPDCGNLFSSLNIAPGLHRAGPCPDGLFRHLEEDLSAHILSRQLHALTLAFKILVTAVDPANREQPHSLPERIRQFLDGNYRTKELNINSLAEHFHLHRVTLCRQFRTQYGLNPSDYLASLRIRKALTLLKETLLPMEEIASQSGFTNANYMAKVLRKNMGESPKEIRKRY